MGLTVSAGKRRAVLVLAGVALALALAVTVVSARGNRIGGAGVGDGPLQISAGETELVFTAPADRADDWSVVAGSFLLCGTVEEVTIRDVAPTAATSVSDFDAVVREFEIRRRSKGLVGEPLLGAYGTPPWVGGVADPREDRLVGVLRDAAAADVRLPGCAETTSAPGEWAAELMLAVSAGSAGARVDGVTVRYTSGGVEYRTDISVALILCGSEVTDPDC